MKKITGLFVMASLLVSAAAFAGPPAKKTKTAKLQEVWTCPIMGSKVTDKKSKTAVVGNYKVHFCCAGCPEQFAKLSAKEKKAKAAEAAKKDKASAKKTKASEVAKETTTKEVALKDVWTCPVSGGAVKDHEAAKSSAVVVGDYRVHFCCEGCPSAFAKLSDAEKKEKAEAAAKKEAGS
jgi:hypothetical protein